MTTVKIGIIGGGQLAGLLAKELAGKDVSCYSLDPDPDSPAVRMGAIGVSGDRQSKSDIAKLAALTDVVTVDLEDVNVDGLAEIETAGARVIPSVYSLRLLTDKLQQKKTLQLAGIPTSRFTECDGSDDFDYGQFGWPVVQKAARGGYDGRGVVILRDEKSTAQHLPVSGYIEEHVSFSKELAVMVAREPSGKTTVWNTVEMEFDPENNLLTYLIAPARCSDEINAAAQEIAKRTIAAFNGVGIFGVELFLTHDNQLLVNEIAPRTHNSGHFTLDACVTSQFIAQYQILTGEPVSDPAQTHPAVMFNVLGEPGFEGDIVIEGLDDLEAADGVFPHMYGKKHCFPFRKMGHVTVIDDTMEKALQKADIMRNRISVRGQNRVIKEKP